MGITTSGVSSVEIGKSKASDLLIKSICREFNVDYDWLMYGEGEMFSNLPDVVLEELRDRYTLSDKALNIVIRFCEQPKEKQDALISFIEAMAQEQKTEEQH